MKRIIGIVLFVLISCFSFAQGDYQDVVYLKNGSVIRGIIIEQVPNKSIKIETSERNIFVFQMDEIEKITKEPVAKKSNLHSKNSLQTGDRWIIEPGYDVGMGDWGIDRLRLNIIGLYQFSPYIAVGFGSGLRYYHEADALVLPFFADLRTYFIDSNITPYFSLGVGYSIEASNDFKGLGLMLNPVLGVNFRVSDQNSLHVGLGYDLQRIKFYDYWSGSFTENSGALSINVGISF